MPPSTSPERAAAQSEQRYWTNTVSLDHVEAAAEGGYTQADHGAKTRRDRPQPGDEMIFYSPGTSLQNGNPVQQFTAWATTTGEEPYQAIVTDDFRPWRLAATFHRSAPVDARALVSIAAPWKRSTRSTAADVARRPPFRASGERHFQ